MLDILESNDEVDAQALRQACLRIKMAQDDFNLKRVPRLLVEKPCCRSNATRMECDWFVTKRNTPIVLSNITICFIGSNVEIINNQSMKSFNTKSLRLDDWETIGRIRLAMMECQIVVLSESLAAEFGEVLLSNHHLPIDMMNKDTMKSTSRHLPDRLKYRLSLEKSRLLHRFEGERSRRHPFQMQEVLFLNRRHGVKR